MTLDNSKQIEYNFYNILAIQSNLSKGKHFLYEGRENEPNVIMYINDESRSFVCKNLYIFASKKPTIDGELLIETVCTSNYDKKVYLRFLLSTNRFSNETPVDRLINSSHNMEINLNSILPNNDDCIFKENYEAVIITFKKPITVKSMFHNFVDNSVEIEENESEIMTYLRENFTSMNNKIKENFTMSVSGELIECHEGEGEEAAMGEAVKKQYDMSVENFLGIYAIIIFVIVVGIIFYALKYIFILLNKLITIVANILGFNIYNKNQRKTILLNFFSTIFIALACYFIIMNFVFGVSAEDTVISDGIEDATGELGSLVDRIGKKVGADKNIIMTIVLLGLAFVSYVGTRWYLSQPLTNANGNQLKDSNGILLTTVDEITDTEGCDNGECNKQAAPAAGQPGQQMAPGLQGQQMAPGMQPRM